jgi:hypothetical protein
MIRKKRILLALILAIITLLLTGYAFSDRNKFKTYPIKDKLYLSSNSSDKILNKFDFAFILNTDPRYCGRNNGQDLLLIAFVPISPNAVEARTQIRTTWASADFLSPSTGKVVFVLGKSGSARVNSELKLEARAYGDLVQSDFSDTYYNLTLKTIMGFKWVASYCQNAKYTLKVDDDVVVNVRYLTRYLKELFERDAHTKNSMLCIYNVNASVVRNSSSKFYLSESEYSRSVFHPYCDGPAYIISTDLIQQLVYYSRYVKLIKLEDVYVGLLARFTNASFINMESAYMYEKESRNLNRLLNVKQKLYKYFFLYAQNLKHKRLLWSFFV